MDFEKLTLDGLIDTGALTSAICEQDLNRIKLLANEAIKETGPPPNFQIMVANGQLEVPIGTVLLEFEVADFMLKENFIIMKNLPNPLIDLCFLRRNNAIFDVTQGILTYLYLSMQLKPDTQTAIRQATPLFAENTYTLQPGETLAIASKMPHLMDHDATGIVTPSQPFKNHDTIFITASLSTVNNNAIGYQIINFSELPYTITMDTHLADFKILTPEQIKHIQPVDPALLSFMIQHKETTEVYINELPKVPQQNSEWKKTGSLLLKNHVTLTLIPQFNNVSTKSFLNYKNSRNSTQMTTTRPGKHSYQISTGPTQRSAQTNDMKLKRFWLNFTTFLPDTVSI